MPFFGACSHGKSLSLRCHTQAYTPRCDCSIALQRIEQLEAENARLREALSSISTTAATALAFTPPPVVPMSPATAIALDTDMFQRITSPPPAAHGILQADVDKATGFVTGQPETATDWCALFVSRLACPLALFSRKARRLVLLFHRQQLRFVL